MKIKIKPVEGNKVRDPYRSDVLPQDGREVERNSYWIRRLKEGSVTLVECAEKPAKKLGGIK
jgi:hypothetical protein